MAVDVRQVSSRQSMERFIRFPLELHRRDPHYVPHLLRERREFFSDSNPLFEFTDVAYLLACDDEGGTIGRVTAHVNHRHNNYWGERTGFFGFFECVERPEVAEALMEKTEQWLREKGMERIRGPFSFSTNEECALLVEGFDRAPGFMMPYNPPYYPRYLQEFGYAKAKDLVSYELRDQHSTPDYMEKFARRASQRTSVNVRKLRTGDFEEEVRRAFSVYNRAWSRNWGFVPMTQAEFQYMAQALRPIVDPDVAVIAEAEGEPVGFCLALPDYAPVFRRMNGRLFPFGVLHWLLGRRRIDTVRVITMGVVDDYRRKGIDMLMIREVFAHGVPKGYHHGEFGWILEDNHLMRRSLERMGASVCSTYRVFEKPL